MICISNIILGFKYNNIDIKHIYKIGYIIVSLIVVSVLIYYKVGSKKNEEQEIKTEKKEVQALDVETTLNRVDKCKNAFTAMATKNVNDDSIKLPSYCKDTPYLQNTNQKQICNKCKVFKTLSSNERKKFISSGALSRCGTNKHCCLVKNGDTYMGCPEFCFNSNLKSHENLSDQETLSILRTNKTCESI